MLQRKILTKFFGSFSRNSILEKTIMNSRCLMRKLLILVLLLNFTALSQAQKEEKSFYTNRHHSIDIPLRGHEAKACVIDGEVYATNDHTDLQKICTSSGGQIVKPSQAKRIANQANRVTAICCLSDKNRRSFVMVRGDVNGDSCGDAGKQIKKSQCFKKDAEIFNHLKFNQTSDKDAIKRYNPIPRNKARARLNEYVENYEKQLNCGVDEKKWLGRAVKNSGSFIGKTFKKFTDLFSPKKNIGEGKSADYNNLDTNTIDRFNQAMPLCCKAGDSYKVVANECACYANAVNTATSSPAQIVGASENTCADLHTSLNSLDELRVFDSHDFLTEQLEEFMKDKKCFAKLKGEMSGDAVCSHNGSSEFLLYELNCPVRERRKRQKLETTTILCHKRLPGTESDSPIDVKFNDIKSTDGAEDGCHIAEKF